MEGLIGFLVHLLIGALVFALLYWLAMLVVSVVPEPMKAPFRIAAVVLLVLIALSFLMGEAGLWGDWGWGYHYRRSR